MSRLPLALEPVPDESWHSYLTRQAVQHGLTMATVGDHLELRGRRGRWLGYHGVVIDDLHATVAGSRLGLAREQVQAMHLSAYDQLAFDLGALAAPGGIGTTREAVHSSWVWLSGSNYCPSCLAESDGAWRLKWRIPWVTSCTRHGIELLAACPACSRVPGLGNQFNTSAPTRLTVVPDGRRCMSAREGRACDTDLSRVRARPVDAHRRGRTERMLALAEGARGTVAGRDYTSLQALRAWQSAIGMAVHLGVVETKGWGRTHRWGAPPRDTLLIDSLLAAVEPLIAAPEVASAADVLTAWCRDAGIRSPSSDTFARSTQPSAALRPVVAEVLSRHGRAHTAIRRRLTTADGGTVDGFGWGSQDLPQLVWPCGLPETLRRHTRPDQRILRAVLSMTLVRWCGDASDWATAGSALGMPPLRACGWARYAYADRWNLKNALLESAETLHSLLSHQPGQRAWSTRPALEGNGLVAFRNAQQPTCWRDDRGSRWCPCTDANPRETR